MSVSKIPEIKLTGQRLPSGGEHDDGDDFEISDSEIPPIIEYEANPGDSEGNGIQMMRSRSRSISSQNNTQIPAIFNLDRESKWKRFKAAHIDPNIGLILLIAAQFFNTTMIASTKLLETNPNTETKIKPLQILVVRMAITYIGTRIYMHIYRDSIDYVPWGRPEVRKWLVLRGCMGFLGVFGSYFSLMYLSISDTVLISFLSPSITILLAWIVLREKVHRYECIGCIAALFGVVLIVRPPFLFGDLAANKNDTGELTEAYNPAESSNPKERLLASMVALVGTFGAGSIYIIIRYIGKKAHAIMSVSYFSLVTLIVSTIGVLIIPSMKFQIPHSLKEWLLFLNLGFSGFFFQLLLTLGIQKERAGRGSLVAYTQMIYALLWDIFLYHHIPSIWSFLGMFIIIGSTLYVFKLKNGSADKDDDLSSPNNLHDEEQQINIDEYSTSSLNIPLQEMTPDSSSPRLFKSMEAL